MIITSGVFDIADFETTFRFSRPNSQIPVPYIIWEVDESRKYKIYFTQLTDSLFFVMIS